MRNVKKFLFGRKEIDSTVRGALVPSVPSTVFACTCGSRKRKSAARSRRSCSPAGRKKKTSPFFFSPERSAETSTLVQEKRGTGAVTEARVAPLLCLSARWTASLLFPAVCRRRRSTRRCPYLRPYLFFLTGGEKNAHLPSRISFIFVVKTPDAGLDATAAWW